MGFGGTADLFRSPRRSSFVPAGDRSLAALAAIRGEFADHDVGTGPTITPLVLAAKMPA